MRIMRVICGSVLLASSCDLALAEGQLSAGEFKAYQLLLHLTPQQRQAVLQKFGATKSSSTSKIARTTGKAPSANVQATNTSSAAAQSASKDAINATLTQILPGTVFLLRQDWQDIDIAANASTLQAVAQSTGAQISIADDRVKDNIAWTTHGTAALLYNIASANTNTTFGGYVTADKLTNSAATQFKNNVDTLAYGGVFEFGTATDTINPYIANYLQLRGGGVEDYIKHTTAGNLTLEWLPVYDEGPIHIHTPFNPILTWPLIIRFDVEALVQYDGAVGPGETLAFNNMTNALRIGPQVALNIYPGTDPFFSHFHANVIYHWAYETFSSTGLDLLETNLVYNLNQAGNIAVAATYDRGREEATGTYENVFTVSLTGKI